MAQVLPDLNEPDGRAVIDLEDYTMMAGNFSAPVFAQHTEAILDEIDTLAVHYEFQLMDETLYLAVKLIDQFLSLPPIVRKKLQLVGVTAMLLACKYGEVLVPVVVEDLILISDGAYNRKEVLDMERLMVNTLRFNMSVPTPYVFMMRFLKVAESNKKLEFLAFFIVEFCLVEYDMLKFPPFLLAASAICTVQWALGWLKFWSKTCEDYTGYTEKLLLECSKRMVALHQKAGSAKLTAVYRKCSMPNSDCAAKAEPASFLLNAALCLTSVPRKSAISSRCVTVGQVELRIRAASILLLGKASFVNLQICSDESEIM
ncbi:hypothetical protein CDL15_Pgr007211 [Punica granatum]|uniref:Cyclin N-terminal domain-containing protein n=1 Tax=Punica granatum TaxID=22663 RepID=A0A218X8Z5_PUNGR|nr:hypothetical protein CDL15_Pgr007211 [Punica granatum]